MKKLIYFLLLSVIGGSCGNEANPPEPEQQVVKCEPENPALYGKLSGMKLRVIGQAGGENTMLTPVTDNREGLEFAEPRLANILPQFFSVCNIPEAYLKDGLLLNVSGHAYIDDYMMQNAKIIYFDNPNTKLRSTYKIFLDFTEIEVVPQ